MNSGEEGGSPESSVGLYHYKNEKYSYFSHYLYVITKPTEDLYADCTVMVVGATL